MKFSIITIVLNDKQNIEKTILSVINQKIDLEYIIIDGKSNDGTLDIIKRYESKINALVIEKDDGIVDAFNKGINLATGDIVGIVNSGDFLEDNALELVVNSFESDIDIVYGNVQYWDGDEKDYIYSADHRFLDRFMAINHPAVFVKKSIYERFGLFDKNFPIAMDYELMLRFFVNNVRFKYINKVLSNMALGGVSDVNWQRAYKEAYEIRKKHLEFSIRLYYEYKFQVFKRYVSNALTKLGLNEVKSFYRNKFSTIKKSR